MSIIKREKKYIMWGIPVVFLLGSLFHFLYHFSKENFLVGFISPANESIWEHTKMVVIPLLLWWLGFYFFTRNKRYPEKQRWLTSMLVSLIVSIIAIPLMYYFYTEAFGKELLWVDILILLISVAIGQILALHFYRKSKGINKTAVWIIVIAILAGYVILTINPPRLPIFKDPQTNTYGIFEK